MAEGWGGIGPPPSLLRDWRPFGVQPSVETLGLFSIVPAGHQSSGLPAQTRCPAVRPEGNDQPRRGGKSAEFPGFSRLLVRNCFTGIYVGCRSAPHFGVSNTNTPRRFFDQAASL